ncbi:MAG: hypothetical protein M3680_36760, partial [Myxococcota bacterium]|nr:hypothetical protein [Myxococcota bacterium]
SCSTYEVYDTTIEPTSIRSVERQLVSHARGRGMETSTRVLDVAGTDDALIVEYRQAGAHGFDLVALKSNDAKVRMLQCHVPWFENAKSIPTREATCTDTIGVLLTRPVQAGREVSPECTRATNHIAKLPGRTDPPDGSDDLHHALRAFAARCTEKVAACALASTTFVEATLCTD